MVAVQDLCRLFKTGARVSDVAKACRLFLRCLKPQLHPYVDAVEIGLEQSRDLLGDTVGSRPDRQHGDARVDRQPLVIAGTEHLGRGISARKILKIQDIFFPLRIRGKILFHLCADRLFFRQMLSRTPLAAEDAPADADGTVAVRTGETAVHADAAHGGFVSAFQIRMKTAINFHDFGTKKERKPSTP